MKKIVFLSVLLVSLLSCEKEDIKDESIEIGIDQNSDSKIQKEPTLDELLNSKTKKRLDQRSGSSVESGKGLAAKG